MYDLANVTWVRLEDGSWALRCSGYYEDCRTCKGRGADKNDDRCAACEGRGYFEVVYPHGTVWTVWA